MIKVLSVENTRSVEKEIDASGTSYSELMSRAGQAVTNVIMSQIQNLPHVKITIIAGKGNNGGDGIVAANLIKQAKPDAEIRLYLLEELANNENLETARNTDIFIANAKDDKDRRVLKSLVTSSDWVLDALFGIGVRIPIRGNAASVLKAVNQAIKLRNAELSREHSLAVASKRDNQTLKRVQVLAIDCPSGLDCDSGDYDKNTIPADLTVSFIGVKQGLLKPSASDIVGSLIVDDLGVGDHQSLNDFTDCYVDTDYAKSILPHRSENSNKGTFGQLMIVAGSINYVGAPALASKAAYLTGSGLVSVASAYPVVQALAGNLWDTTWLHLPHEMGVIGNGAIEVLIGAINKYKALLIGPGLTTEKATQQFLIELLQDSQEKTASPSRKKSIGFLTSDETSNAPSTDQDIVIPPLIIDADALNILSQYENWPELLPSQTIITPHPGEMARLTGISVEKIQADRRSIASTNAQKWGVIVVLKGAYTVIADPKGMTYTLPFANSGLAVAGTGDVLAGIIAGLRGQGVDATNSAILGGYIHGLAGELASQELGKRSLTASALLNFIAPALKLLEP